jgi:hypothetical protein
MVIKNPARERGKKIKSGLSPRSFYHTQLYQKSPEKAMKNGSQDFYKYDEISAKSCIDSAAGAMG